jgi:hypothetical protein
MVISKLLIAQMLIISSAGVSARIIWEGQTLQLRHILFPVIVSLGMFTFCKGKFGAFEIDDDIKAYGYAGLTGAFGKDIVVAIEKWVKNGGIYNLLIKFLPDKKNKGE